MQKLKEKIKRLGRVIRATAIRKIIHLTRRIHLPGFEGISVWEVLFFFVWTIRRGLITTRAASLSFHFFLAMIPFGLVLVTVSAFLPFFDIENDIEPLLSGIIPKAVLGDLLGNLEAYHTSKVSSWLSVGFVTALYFTSNGFSVMIKTFNGSVSKFSKRNWWSTKLMSLGFVFVFIIGILMLFFAEILIQRMMNYGAENSVFITNNYNAIFNITSFFVLGTFLYFGVAFFYYFGPSKRDNFRFFSAGASLATLCIIIVSFLYSSYITKFATYNDLYGSLGTIMIILLWIYINSLVLLIGFELNASIHGAIQKKKLNHLNEIEERYVKDY